MRPRQLLLGIDLGSAAVKVVALESGHGPRRLVGAGWTPLPGQPGSETERPDSEQLAGAVSRALEQAGVEASPRHRTVVGIGGTGLALRLLSLPRLAEAEAREAVKWEAAQSLPFPVEEAVFDFHLFPGAGEQMEVLFVAARAAWVEAVTAAVLKAGLEPGAVDAAPLALGRTLQAVGWTGAGRMVATIDLGHAVTEVGLFRGDDLVFGRVIPGGRQALSPVLTQAAAAAEEPPGAYVDLMDPVRELAHEVQRSLDYYRAQHQWLEVDQLAVTGCGAGAPELVQFLGEATGIPARLLPVAKAVTASSSIPVPWDELGVAVGLALREVAP
ncbi:MAG: pilus assembly protein PilM [Bacillota bacterium]|nr:pilus assembly protein PilM [Bacillota bacterium]